MGIANVHELITGQLSPKEIEWVRSFEVYNLGLNSDWSEGASGGQVFEDSMFGLAAAILSFSTNAVAPCLITYKAWYVHQLGRPCTQISFRHLEFRRHRRDVSKYLEHIGSKTPRSGAILAILAESGLVYCAIWVMPDFLRISICGYLLDLCKRRCLSSHSWCFRTRK